MALTTQDVQKLKAPFAANDHEMLRGYVYLKEQVICDRIEEVDPSWEFTANDPVVRESAGTKSAYTVTVVATLTINGVSRTNTGMASVESTKSGDSEANEAEKSAMTDALKRCARLFGIGRYILDMPKVNDVRAIENWLKSTYGKPSNTTQMPSKSQQAPNIEPPADATQFRKDIWAQVKDGFVTYDQMEDALLKVKDQLRKDMSVDEVVTLLAAMPEAS